MNSLNTISDILEIYYDNSMLDLLEDLNIITFEDLIDVLMQSTKQEDVLSIFYEAQREVLDFNDN